MVMTLPIREAPITEPLSRGVADSSHPDASDEPVLNVGNIQGNILAGGFTKDHQTLLVLEINDSDAFKQWLASQIPFIATAEEVITFNQLFKATRKRRGREGTVKATWVNIAFSHQALIDLGAIPADGTPGVDDFLDQAFREGLANRAADLRDPVDDDGEPIDWVVGGPDNDEADVLLIVASDDRADMLAEVARIEDSVIAFRTEDGEPASSGAEITFREEGANLPPPLSGHEHFGFLDGVSQPGVRGRISDDPHDVLTPRQNPENREQGKPGQELLWPGEFVFGYVGQDPNADDLEHSEGPNSLTGEPPAGKDPADRTGPDWAQDGAFLVFRRLRQDVFRFHNFLRDKAGEEGVPDPANTSAAALVGAKLVGRWPSGAPVLRTPDQEDIPLADDDCANNDFEFHTSPPKPGTPTGPDDCADNFPGLPKDDEAGVRCPFTGHVRKAYPRNDLTPEGVGSEPDPAKQSDKSEVHTQTHRMLRRGIPYGEVSRSTPTTPTEDNVDRGLHFLAYETSIEDQFEFVIENWVNNPTFSTEAATGHPCDGTPTLTGHDPIIGQSNGPGGDRTRTFFIRFGAGGANCRQLVAPDDWVHPTGGGYFFAPSIAALREHLT